MSAKTTKITTTAQVTVAGITRTVEVIYWVDADGNRSGAHVGGVVAQIGRGAARYPSDVSLFPVTEQRPAPRGAARTTAADGTEWCYDMGTGVRNRQARVVAWSTEMPATNLADQTRL